LRVVIRENMSFDLLDRLVADIVQVTETLIDHDGTDWSLLQKHVHKSHRHPVQKGHHKKDKHGGMKKAEEEVGRDVKRMAEGIHRSVC
jgi:glutamate decarboxylase